jgi:hypothetical protein
MTEEEYRDKMVELAKTRNNKLQNIIVILICIQAMMLFMQIAFT